MSSSPAAPGSSSGQSAPDDAHPRILPLPAGGNIDLEYTDAEIVRAMLQAIIDANAGEFAVYAATVSRSGAHAVECVLGRLVGLVLGLADLAGFDRDRLGDFVGHDALTEFEG